MRCRADDGGIAVAPVVSVATEYAGLPSLNQNLGAIAVIFDFVNPVLAFGRLIDRRSKLGLNELERDNAGHATYSSQRTTGIEVPSTGTAPLDYRSRGYLELALRKSAFGR